MKTFPLAIYISGCRKGDPKAQEAIYKYFAARMLAICRRYTDNTMEAEDILQESFVKVFTRIDTYSGEGNFEGWMKRIMVNTALTAYRQKQRQVQTCDIATAAYPFGAHSINNYDDAAYLMSMLDRLHDKYRVPFNLFAIEGYSHEEISGMIGISVEQSRVRVCRARTSLRESVANYRAAAQPRRLEMTA